MPARSTKPSPHPAAASSKPAPAHQQAAAKPKTKTAAREQATPKPKSAPRSLARRRARPMREVQNDFARRYAQERPHSGPVYETPQGTGMPPPTAMAPSLFPGCDETCQYRDWLNRYAAWYRDFGRYYYAPPPGPAAPPSSMPPGASYGENRPPPVPRPAYRQDESERARLDPWHGYNSHDGPGNGY